MLFTFRRARGIASRILITFTHPYLRGIAQTQDAAYGGLTKSSCAWQCITSDINRCVSTKLAHRKVRAPLTTRVCVRQLETLEKCHLTMLRMTWTWESSIKRCWWMPGTKFVSCVGSKLSVAVAVLPSTVLLCAPFNSLCVGHHDCTCPIYCSLDGVFDTGIFVCGFLDGGVFSLKFNVWVY